MTQKFNYLTIDEGAVIERIKKHYIRAMEKAEKELIKLMRREIKTTTHGDAPGKPKWRAEISSLLQETYREITDDYVEMGVGLPEQLTSSSRSLLMKAMIILEGSGSKVGNAPITAGPTGRIVWDGDMAGQHESRAKTETGYPLPAEFNQVGNQFIDNAVRQMVQHFTDILEEASATLSDSIFYGNVTSKER